MLTLQPAKKQDVALFTQMEMAQDTSSYIIPYTEEQHIAEMEKNEIKYLSIYQQNTLIGFIILALESGTRVEFRRIVIAQKGCGYGQIAMQLLEQYCKQELQKRVIWLDVFESNKRGIHIYQKLGYQQFELAEHEGKTLLLMQKELY